MAIKSKNQTVKIAMVGHKRIPSREGGIEVVVEELSTRLVDHGYEVTCFNRGGHHVSGKEYDLTKLDNYKGVRLKTIFTIPGKGIAAMSSSFFGAIASAFGNFDIVHFHAEGPSAMLWIPKIFKKKCIVTIHGIDWKREKWKSGFGSKYIRLGEKMAAKHADEIIVLSKDVQDYFYSTYGRKTTLIPNGVTKPKICKSDIITKEFGLSKDDYILFLGRIVPEKGLKYLIEAYKTIDTEKNLL